MLYEEMLNLKKEFNGITSNPIINAVSCKELEHFELEAISGHNFYKEKISNMSSYIKKITIDINESTKSFYNEYLEALNYRHLSNSTFIRHISEGKTKTPDFQIIFEGKNYFLEIKSPFFANAYINYKDTQYKGLDMYCDMETQHKNGATTAIGEMSIRPYANSKDTYRPNSKLTIIETLIDKIEQNYKEEQFQMGETLLLFDLRGLGLSASSEHALLPVYQEVYNGRIAISSGELWNTAFAEHNDIIFYPPMDFPYSNYEGRLKRRGVLNEHEKIRGIIFQTKSMDPDKYEYVGLAKEGNSEILKLLKHLCVYYNDDKSNYRHILEKI